ncbi:MAG: helix-turn-helix domain-containing protein [Pseudomonadota bacterium]
MSTLSAKTANGAPAPHRLVFVIYPEIALLDLAGPLQVFAGTWWPGTKTRVYDISIVSAEGGRIQSDSLVSIDSDPIHSLAKTRIDTLIIVGGDGVYTAAEDRGLVESIARFAARSDRVCSICSGAYLLAAAGLLAGRRAVTHWQDAEILERDFPEVRLELDPIFIKDGNIWTSAGVTAGTDMALALVAEDWGREAALERARALVTYMVRPGGQSQFSPVLERQSLDHSGKFEELHGWIAENLKRDLSVEALASHQNMSLRNFYRQYQATMGITPARAVEAIRTEAARDMLETTDASIKTIASKCGYGTESRMRRAFSRVLGVSPSAYRERFKPSET